MLSAIGGQSLQFWHLHSGIMFKMERVELLIVIVNKAFYL